MVTKMRIMLLLIGLAASLSCRAVASLVNPDSPDPELDQPFSPGGTGVEDLPAEDDGFDADNRFDAAPKEELDLVPTWTPELPGEIEDILPEMPEFPEIPDVSPGTPFSGESFRGVPVMENAQNATESAGALTFYIDQSIEDVADYYLSVMAEHDWQSMASPTEDAGGTFLIYTKGEDVSTIAILPDFMRDYETMVMIVVP